MCGVEVALEGKGGSRSTQRKWEDKVVDFSGFLNFELSAILSHDPT